MLSVSASDKARCIVKASQSSRDITIVGDTPDLTSAFSVSNVELTLQRRVWGFILAV